MDFLPPYIGNGKIPGPGTSLVLWVHHDGESHWMEPTQIRERIVEIRFNKPSNEIMPRLRKMTIIPYRAISSKAYSKYEAINSKADSKYQAINSKADFEYQAISKKADSKYEAIRSKAYSKYQAIRSKTYFEYQAISKKADSKYEAIRSKAYSKYEAIRSKADSKYQAIRSKAIAELLKSVDMTKAVSGLEYEKTMLKAGDVQ